MIPEQTHPEVRWKGKTSTGDMAKHYVHPLDNNKGYVYCCHILTRHPEDYFRPTIIRTVNGWSLIEQIHIASTNVFHTIALAIDKLEE